MSTQCEHPGQRTGHVETSRQAAHVDGQAAETVRTTTLACMTLYDPSSSRQVAAHAIYAATDAGALTVASGACPSAAFTAWCRALGCQRVRFSPR